MPELEDSILTGIDKCLTEQREHVARINVDIKALEEQYSARIEVLRNSPCPRSPTGRHTYHGFAESVGVCEHCGLDGGWA